MVPHSARVALLKLAHFVYHLYNLAVFLSISLYYNALLFVEKQQQQQQQHQTTRSALDASNGETINGNHHHHHHHHHQHQQLHHHVSNIPKDLRIPKHIAMTFTNESHCLSLDSIASLLCWCKELGVRDITLYDDLGRLKQSENQLYESLEQRLGLLGYEKPISYLKGLKIISRSDGRRKFVESVQSLMQVPPDKIDSASVDERVGWPTDPELLICFGSPLCLYGFPPWQLRLTEIFSVPTHRNLPHRIFVDCLEKYSRTTQRIGA